MKTDNISLADLRKFLTQQEFDTYMVMAGKQFISMSALDELHALQKTALDRKAFDERQQNAQADIDK